MKCDHAKRATVYQRGPKAKGSPFVAVGQRCRSCGAFIPSVIQGGKT